MTAVERDYKMSQGRQLYVKGFSLPNISEIIGVGEKTLRDWRDSDNWEEEKELAALKPSNIRRLTLKCALAIEKGEALPYKADDISKIVAAFDRITDSRKKAVYTMESLDGFCEFQTELAAKSKGAKRDDILDSLKAVRVQFDKYITQLLQHD
ncbi:hypothetical protein C1A40_13915 [Tamlana carrageenivorans]|uniref:Terminase ATPase subunit N-terminal domain-containing protein n=2 Tax=Pseudotamlana carrageenivorans TaxID=2069432 RepID=A0A2I7SN68_9FLAO|nr:hypothetical protein C1A40_13915 [Tamlana carrageenivorans]